jgi:nicotinic acid phosphoribosyltransferase
MRASRDRVTMVINLVAITLKAPLNALSRTAPVDSARGAGRRQPLLAWLTLALSFAVWNIHLCTLSQRRRAARCRVSATAKPAPDRAVTLFGSRRSHSWRS